MQPGSHAASLRLVAQNRFRFAASIATNLCQPALLRGGVASPSAMRCVTSSVQPPAANANTRPSGLQA